MYYGYVQQSGLYETLDLVITDFFDENYADYYKNNSKWYLTKHSENIKEVIEHLWFTYNAKLEVKYIKLELEDSYKIDSQTIKIMFSERLLVQI